MGDNFVDNYRKWHTSLSYAKSVLRIVGCVGVIFLWQTVTALAIVILLAELLGVAEEWV